MTKLDLCATASRPRRRAFVLRDARLPIGAANADHSNAAKRMFVPRGIVGGMQAMRLRASVTGGDP